MTVHPARFLALLTLLAAFLLPACVTNPATGKRQLNVLSRDEEIALGTEASQELIPQYGGAYPDQSVQAYVDEIGARLAQHVELEYADLPWEFTLLDSDVINAFALPGGKVFITRGLAARFENEAQLAGVLGHEIGHVTAEHIDKRVANQTILAAGVGVTGLIIGQSTDEQWLQAAVPVVVGGVGQGFLLKFSRDEESESDRLGLRYMVRAGYNPRGQLGVMQVLNEASQGQARGIEILSTHPLPQTRIDRIRRLLDEQYAREAASSDGYYEQRYRERLLSRVPPPSDG